MIDSDPVGIAAGLALWGFGIGLLLLWRVLK